MASASEIKEWVKGNYVISDIHGCLKTLIELVTRLRLTAKDQVFFLGDYIDRRPDSAGVLDFIIDLKSRKNIIVQNANYGVIVRKSDVEISGNFFINNTLGGIHIDNETKFEIAYNIFINHTKASIDISASNIGGKIFNNTIDNTAADIYFSETFSSGLDLEIFNNIFYKCNYALNCPGIFSKKIENNLFFGNQKDVWDREMSIVIDLPKSNIISDPQFIDSEKYNYGVQNTSPCIKAGLEGVDIGAINYVAKKKDPTTFKMAGIVTNVCVNKSAGASMVLSKIDDDNYSLKGEFDNKNLFGRFDIQGKKLPKTRGEGVQCIQFIGEIHFGDGDGSGFDPNTKTTFVVTLTLVANGAKGVYHIGKILQYSDIEQYGVLDLYYEEKY